jgi:PadR family transcriptional regulator, regulatory protein PadR
MAKRETGSPFMNGVPELLVLRLLQDREMYGYELMQAIRERTGEAVTLAEGVVYPVLHALEQDGALKARRKTVGGRSRIYYSLTAMGTKRLTGLASSWAALRQAVQTILTGGTDAKLA